MSGISLSLKLDLHSSSSALAVDLNSISLLKNSSTSSSLAAPAAAKHHGIMLRNLIASSEWAANLLSISDFKWQEICDSILLVYLLDDFSSSLAAKSSWYSYINIVFASTP